MSIRLRLAVVFTAAAALLFALGSWLFVAELSASLLGSIDAQLASQLSRAARYVPASPAPASPPPGAGSPAPGEYVVQVIDPAGRVRGGSADAGTTPLLSRAQISQARQHGVRGDQVGRGRAGAGDGQAAGCGTRAGSRWPASHLEAFDRTRSDVTRELVIAGAGVRGRRGAGRVRAGPGGAVARSSGCGARSPRVSARDPAPGLQVPRTRDEIAALATTMNELLGRLQDALARQRALVADASHELRTPFAVLRGELELAGRPGRSREELAAAVDRASEEVARLARITEQLLFLARSDEDRIPPRLERTNISALLDPQRGARGRARASEAGVTLRVDAPAELVAEVDPDRIREAVDNLVDNALRFAPAGTPVVIAARAGRPGPGHRGPRRWPRLPRRVPAARLRALRAAGLRARAQRRGRRPGTGDRERHRARSRRAGHRAQSARRRCRGRAGAPGARGVIRVLTAPVPAGPGPEPPRRGRGSFRLPGRCAAGGWRAGRTAGGAGRRGPRRRARRGRCRREAGRAAGSGGRSRRAPGSSWRSRRLPPNSRSRAG